MTYNLYLYTQRCYSFSHVILLFFMLLKVITFNGWCSFITTYELNIYSMCASLCLLGNDLQELDNVRRLKNLVTLTANDNNIVEIDLSENEKLVKVVVWEYFLLLPCSLFFHFSFFLILDMFCI
jgi:hypothetical protein